MKWVQLMLLVTILVLQIVTFNRRPVQQLETREFYRVDSVFIHGTDRYFNTVREIKESPILTDSDSLLQSLNKLTNE
jgi:hypothetical protein